MIQTQVKTEKVLVSQDSLQTHFDVMTNEGWELEALTPTNDYALPENSRIYEAMWACHIS